MFFKKISVLPLKIRTLNYKIIEGMAYFFFNLLTQHRITRMQALEKYFMVRLVVMMIR